MLTNENVSSLPRLKSLHLDRNFIGFVLSLRHAAEYRVECFKAPALRSLPYRGRLWDSKPEILLIAPMSRILVVRV